MSKKLGVHLELSLQGDDLTGEEVEAESMLACTEAEAWGILSDSYMEFSVAERFSLLRTFSEEVHRAPELVL